MPLSSSNVVAPVFLKLVFGGDHVQVVSSLVEAALVATNDLRVSLEDKVLNVAKVVSNLDFSADLEEDLTWHFMLLVEYLPSLEFQGF